MRKRVSRVEYIILLSICMGVSFGCASDQSAEYAAATQEITQNPSQEEQETAGETIEERKEETSVQESDSQEESTEAYFPEDQLRKNEERFFEEAEKQGIDRQTADTYFQILTDNNIFQDGAMALTGLMIDDIDNNGQEDMLVMVLDAQETPIYGSGSLWFYMNEDEPYCFSEEDCSYYGWFDVFWYDIDNDENVEIVFSAQGTGCGAVGDSYKAVFKYRNHAMERMRLPTDFEEDYDCGLGINVFQEPHPDSYSAYCDYMKEQIYFQAENSRVWELSDTEKTVGGNVRGFYNLCVVEYEGKNALQASEYLSAEGGIVHCVGIAKFIITWEADGTPKVADWWIETDNG
ncbi:MAG: hypothetical protein K2N95_10150 [Lachnospiraceae bacterium]|nr:hypothetical protein [Lachnospiraceae bacterium]